jgi:hypothetical protein
MQDFLKQLDTRMQDLEVWKRSDLAREKLSILDGKVGRYLLLGKISVWASAILGALVVGYLSWKFMEATPQLICLGSAAFIAVYALFKISWLITNPPKASAIALEEIENHVAPAKVMFRIARLVLPKLKTNS